MLVWNRGLAQGKTPNCAGWNSARYYSCVPPNPDLYAFFHCLVAYVFFIERNGTKKLQTQ